MLYLAGSPDVDKVLHYRLHAGGWGLLGDDARPHCTYEAAWLLSRHVPRGATLCDIQTPAEGALAAAVFTQTARNIVLVNGADSDAVFTVQPLGMGIPAVVRLRRLDMTSSGLSPRTLSPADRYEVHLRGPGMAVLEFCAEA
jgi:hypothetical protein